MGEAFRSGRSGEARTPGLMVPNHARYRLRYTPIYYSAASGTGHSLTIIITPVENVKEKLGIRLSFEKYNCSKG